MAEPINTDSLLLGVAAPQQRTLDVIADMIIPASADGRKPSAQTVGVLKYIREHEPESLPAVCPGARTPRRDLARAPRHRLRRSRRRIQAGAGRRAAGRRSRLPARHRDAYGDLLLPGRPGARSDRPRSPTAVSPKATTCPLAISRSWNRLGGAAASFAKRERAGRQPSTLRVLRTRRRIDSSRVTAATSASGTQASASDSAVAVKRSDPSTCRRKRTS